MERRADVALEIDRRRDPRGAEPQRVEVGRHADGLQDLRDGRHALPRRQSVFM
jgi:hypothetical protein